MGCQSFSAIETIYDVLTHCHNGVVDTFGESRLVRQLEVLEYRFQHLDSKTWNSTTLELLTLCSQTADRPQHDTHWSILLQSRNYTFSNLWDNLDACMLFEVSQKLTGISFKNCDASMQPFLIDTYFMRYTSSYSLWNYAY